MPTVELSFEADRDFQGISDYTKRNFGIRQYRSYGAGLMNCAKGLAEQPLLGRSIESHGSDLRRYEYKSHVLIFRPTASGILLVRILHQGMDIFKHLEG